jgi:uncharacterized DUF497 family protein
MTYNGLVKFEWDEKKAQENFRKHGLRFSEAVHVFSAKSCLEIYDADHSQSEDRFITVGPIRRGLVLVVWTERHANVTRVISARFATSKEQRLYLEHLEESK